ncbi:MAG: hypothetical protein ACYDHO_00920 [Gaiellaceae bacterium]
MLVKNERPSTATVGEFPGERLQRVLSIGAVRAVRQEILVFRVGDEEQPEENGQCLLVDVPQRFLVEVVFMPARERDRE